MCGIFGWDIDTSKLRAHQKTTMATALMLGNDDRGGQGWGYWSPDWTTEQEPKKGLAHISQAVYAATLAQIPRLIAHTRFATTGGIMVENCHPFVCGKVIGAHNGCVSNCWDLDRKYRNCAVDSQHIFWHLNDEESLESIEAYGAVEFCYKDDPQDIHLAHFNGGDLAVARTRAGVIWSSSQITLRLALRMARMRYRMYILEEDRLYYVRNRVLYETEYDLGVAPYYSSFKWDKNKSYSGHKGSSSSYTGSSYSQSDYNDYYTTPNKSRTDAASGGGAHFDESDDYSFTNNFPDI